MEIATEDPTAIRIPERLRALDPAKVKQLAESMSVLGLQQPVTTWRPVDGDLELVAGAHRVKAACDLGWKWIDTIDATGMTDIDRQLWEIDENLMRAELTTAEHADHLARRKKLWAVRETQVAQPAPPEKPVGNKSPPKQKKGFAAETAGATGLSKATINRAVSRGEAIPDDVLGQIKGTKLDTGVYLDSLKGMEPEDQRAKVTVDLAKPKKPKRSFGIDAVEAEFQKLQWLWGQASYEAQRRFKKWVSKQVPSVYDDGDGDA